MCVFCKDPIKYSHHNNDNVRPTIGAQRTRSKDQSRSANALPLKLITFESVCCYNIKLFII